MRGGRSHLRKLRGARCRNGSYGSYGSGKRRGERRRRCWPCRGGAGGRRSATAFPPFTLFHGICGRGLGGGSPSSFVLSYVRTLFLRDFFGAHPSSWDRPGRGAKGEPATSRHARTADWKRTVHIFAMTYLSDAARVLKYFLSHSSICAKFQAG